MKRNKLAITFLSAAGFAVGCHKAGTPSKQLDKVQVKTEQAAQQIKDYSYAQKDQFVQQMQGQLTGLKRDLDQLAAKIETSSDAVKAEAEPKQESAGKSSSLGAFAAAQAGRAVESRAKSSTNTRPFLIVHRPFV